MSNLPSFDFHGVVEYVASVEIDAPLGKVWDIVTDFASYPLWNPYHRSAVIVDDASHKPTQDQSLRADATLQLAMQMPPTLDLDSASGKSKKPTVVHERISLVDRAAHRITWGGGRLPSLFRGEHAQALSVTVDGKTLYETRDVIGGISRYLFQRFMGTAMQQCVQDVASALKQRAEA